jgi:exosortase A-associated hydrolase 1
MRRLIAFPCAGETLVATLDEATGTTGLLIVSGGNEIRIGAHRGMAMLAQALAAAGVPVLRYDRRGIGDSSGTNAGFESTAEDIAAAAAALRGTGVTRVVAFGNCDAASALALFHAGVGIDALVLSNPWTGGGDTGDMPQSAAIKARYAERLRDPNEWLRLLRGGVNLRKLIGGLLKVARSGSEDHGLVDRMGSALKASKIDTTILLAERDNTAIAFRDAWAKCAQRTDAAIVSLDSASHSYAGAADKAWLYDRLIAATRTT